MKDWLTSPITRGEVVSGVALAMLASFLWGFFRVWVDIRRKTGQPLMTDGYSPTAAEQGLPPTSKTAVVTPPPITSGTLDEWKRALR